FAEPEDVEADLVGKLYLFEKVLQTFGTRRPLVCGSGIHVRESVKSKFHGIFDPCGFPADRASRPHLQMPDHRTQCSTRRIGSPRHATRISPPADIHGISCASRHGRNRSPKPFRAWMSRRAAPSFHGKPPASGGARSIAIQQQG